MKYHDSYSEAEMKAKDAMKFLASHRLAFSPIHFAVAYQHVSATNTRLSQSLLEILEKSSPDPYEMEILFDKYISENQPKSDKSIEGLTKCIEKLETVNQDSDSAIDGLDHTLKVHSGTKKPDIRSIVDAAKEVRSAHERVNKQLKETQQQSKLLQKELASAREMAITDTLTGLNNRIGMDQFLQNLQPEEFNNMSVAIADIDHFKMFNDDFGHLVGDLILKRLGKLLTEELPMPCKGFRFGGEEFVIVMPQCNPKQAKTVAENIRTEVSKLRFVSSKTRERLPKMTISLGVTSWREEDHIELVLARADQALYEAKNNGRNQVRQI